VDCKCAHGTSLFPAPATWSCWRRPPVYSSGLQAELVTPTGRAIVKTLASRFGVSGDEDREVRLWSGSRDFPGHPNVLRLTIGEAASNALSAKTASETITCWKPILDDLNPQVFGYVMDRLFEGRRAGCVRYAGADEEESSRGRCSRSYGKPEDTAS